MPNHVQNRVWVAGPEIARLEGRAFSKDNEGKPRFDFNAFIPMPPDIERTVSGTVLDVGMALHGWEESRDGWRHVGKARALSEWLLFSYVQDLGLRTWQQVEKHLRKRHPAASGVGRRCVDNVEKHGFADWYGWSCHHWGTKWNAYDTEIVFQGESSLEFTFETAWSAPEPVLKAMALRFPSLSFRGVWFDDGWCHCGRWTRNVGSKFAFDLLRPREGDVESVSVFQEAYGKSPEAYEAEAM